ncbi:hypothetical protein FISHEDRAFT_49198 [Fistulina hepatica ATCC 64428]|uniref:Pre-mRNA-splicing factor CEF1 n=1 Tax=Fistulina hepatica ATCC 64428 TaxID=1128425 RepID=A0A0D7A4Y1_9AGAR|nr:hypothetical protein FISHEDRAFT_49198 [Fistulina hepatica ATCC 64428]
MVRIIIKGGVWKNTEDEVLKAAIAKYGKNQWARISSLLVRKTPKQCKARWYEWLDPSIKKTEWSKEEDEKLLHLAKLMPTQWRTIAPIVGRTATQCLERYQKLLDEAEAKENEELGLTGVGSEAGPSHDVRRLRPGEIDPDPETKPARPDPIDMDEVEKEMLSEARARLANTQGKKAKRKARERQLEEARRLAVLQKKRELKAAGIIMRSKTKRRGMDYNADIPFEKKPAPGYYDTSEEQARIAAAPVGKSLRRLENKRKPDEEETERKKRQKTNKDDIHQTKFIAARDAQIQKLREAESISRRRKLMLPPAQVGEAELEDIVKIGMAGENAKALVGSGMEASERLLSDYEGLEGAKMARTPRTAPMQDNVMSEARNLRNMAIAQTPLFGEENTPLHVASDGGTGFGGATPRHQVAFTPNPLATPRSVDGAAPSVAGTPLRTPLRDSLAINPGDATQTPVAQTPREQRLRDNAAKRALQAGFLSLPKPENNFELLVPEDEETEVAEGSLTEEDAAERDARLERMRKEEERKVLARRSQVVRLDLPRPPTVDVARLMEALSVNDDANADMAVAQRALNEELAQLLYHDSIAYPLPGTTTPGYVASTYSPPPDDDITAARSLIHDELSQEVGIVGATPAQLKEGLLALAAAQGGDVPQTSWADRLVFNPADKMWVDRDAIPLEARLEGYALVMEQRRAEMSRVATRVGKTEKKLGVVLGGYEKRGQALAQRITAAFEGLREQQLAYNAFDRLKANEDATGPRRAAALKEEVERLEQRERRLQERYKELHDEKLEVEHRVAERQKVLDEEEERMMREAEEINEAALRAMGED